MEQAEGGHGGQQAAEGPACWPGAAFYNFILIIMSKDNINTYSNDDNINTYSDSRMITYILGEAAEGPACRGLPCSGWPPVRAPASITALANIIYIYIYIYITYIYIYSVYIYIYIYMYTIYIYIYICDDYL